MIRGLGLRDPGSNPGGPIYLLGKMRTHITFKNGSKEEKNRRSRKIRRGIRKGKEQAYSSGS